MHREEIFLSLVILFLFFIYYKIILKNKDILLDLGKIEVSKKEYIRAVFSFAFINILLFVFLIELAKVSKG